MVENIYGRQVIFTKKNINKTNHTDVQRIGDQDISQQEKDRMEETNQMHLDLGES